MTEQNQRGPDTTEIWDVGYDADGTLTYECLDCGETVTSATHPGNCPDCGASLRNVSMPIE